MRQERLYILVGLFVGGAICLSVLTALYIYDEYLHERVETYVMFFKGSLAGVHVTSEVTYRGVKIGEVKLIEITENSEKSQIKIPVYVQFFVERKFVGKQNPIQLLVNRGYVANIRKPNFLTGIASIDLIRGPSSYKTSLTHYNGYPIFPTNNAVEDYTTLDDAIRSANQAFQDFSDLIRGERIRGAIDSTSTMAHSVDRMVQDIDKLVPPTINSFAETIKRFSALVDTLDKLMPPTLADFSNSLKEVSSLATDLDQVMTPALADFSQGMRQVSDAANSTQNLADYLARHPESLIRGKK
ncbi:Paraquat-inducible protein B [Legionella massiliensis]|uniref:Paraquat-inducible protein B n=1 Tax=Legionella massiliensis TaxID=1034943 RepID=A0A078KVP4_9GAMM|nr:MlaD family protein [Legionella massiliensis]CDZ77077.1 Paraquat-inducible protein B [Legionella massiliensis]CEE12815.1 Paraquat-inducible protein B [Legionella massiliensis]